MFDSRLSNSCRCARPGPVQGGYKQGWLGALLAHAEQALEVSAMAEAWVDARWGNRWEACSAGTRPPGYVHPMAAAVQGSPEAVRQAFHRVRDGLAEALERLLRRVEQEVP